MEEEERFYLQVTTTGAIVAPRWVYMQPFLLWAEAMIAPNILYAEAFKLSDAERVRQALQRQIGPEFTVLPISVNDPSLALPAEIRKVINA